MVGKSLLVLRHKKKRKMGTHGDFAADPRVFDPRFSRRARSVSMCWFRKCIVT